MRSESWRVELELWRVEWRDRKALILSDVAACARREAVERECVSERVSVCEGGSGEE